MTSPASAVRARAAEVAQLPATVGALIAHQLEDHPELRPWYELMTDEQSRVHEGEVHALESEHIVAGVFARFQFFELRHRDR